MEVMVVMAEVGVTVGTDMVVLGGMEDTVAGEVEGVVGEVEGVVGVDLVS